MLKLHFPTPFLYLISKCSNPTKPYRHDFPLLLLSEFMSRSFNQDDLIVLRYRLSLSVAVQKDNLGIFSHRLGHQFSYCVPVQQDASLTG